MKKPEYRIEVGSLRLSDEFKENLKAKMLEEYNEKGKTGPDIEITNNKNFAQKYGKYAAVAAALLLVVSTVSVATVGGLQRAKSEDAADSAQMKAGADAVNDASEEILEAPGFADIPEPEPEAEVEEEILAEVPVEPEAETPDEPEMTLYSDEIPIDDSEQVDEELPPSDNNPMSNYAPSSYDGDYRSEDYLNTATGSGEGLPDTSVVSKLILNKTVISAPAVASAENEAAVDDGESVSETSPAEAPMEAPVEAPVEEPDEAPVEEPVDAPLEEDVEEIDEAIGYPVQGSELPEDEDVEMPNIDYDFEPTDPTAITEEETTEVAEEESVSVDVVLESEVPQEEEIIAVNPCTDIPEEEPYDSYYDYRDHHIDPNVGTGLVKFEIVKAYSPAEISYAAPGIFIDPTAQTLYKIKIKYDYFGSQNLDINRLMISDGAAAVQLEGRPVLSGEYIARITENSDGIIEPDANMIYKIYNINGVDIAYHIWSDLGNNINPGDTDMGLDESEAEVYTTAGNNPEKYVHKAAVNELTRYLRRNLLRMEPKLLDLSSGAKAPESEISASYAEGAIKIDIADGLAEFPDPDGKVKAILEEMGAEIGNKTCSVITKDGSKAYFKEGVLTGLDAVSADKPFYLRLGGVTTGMSSEEALRALGLEGRKLEPNGVIKISARDGDGWSATVRVENGRVTGVGVRITG